MRAIAVRPAEASGEHTIGAWRTPCADGKAKLTIAPAVGNIQVARNYAELRRPLFGM
jgi:hypothetical protein